MRIHVKDQKQVLEMYKNGVGIKQIVRSLTLSRNSVRKIVQGLDEAASASSGIKIWAWGGVQCVEALGNSFR